MASHGFSCLVIKRNTRLTNTLKEWRIMKSKDGLSVVKSESGVIHLTND